MFTITTACGDETISEAENEQDTEETSKEQANDNSVVQEETDKGNEAGKTSNSNNSSENNNGSSNYNSNNSNVDENDNSSTSDSEKEKKTIHFSSGSEAIDYLRKELDMENNEDIIFDDMGGRLEKDSYGSYYTIVLYVKTLKEAGGSGTAGIYKVYQDGKYEFK